MHKNIYIINAGSYHLYLGKRTHVMGIVNNTPDSFSSDGCLREKHDYHSLAVKKSLRHIKEGADIIDIGGESTRPGAARVSVAEEMKRVIPVIRQLKRRNIPVPVSIDTYKVKVAQAALDEGAVIVNNIMGVLAHESLLKMVRNYGAAIVLMHTTGTPRAMQKKIFYKQLMPEIISSLRVAIDRCLDLGLTRDQIIVDPGIGFGKTVDHNLTIINQLDEVIKTLHQPLLVGPSRKSFIGHVLKKDISRRLTGTIASVSACIMKGAHVIRVHDVKVMKEAATMIDAVLNKTLDNNY